MCARRGWPRSPCSEDGTIETTYTFRDGGFEGERKRYTPRGFVRDPSTNATWGMQFLWPFRMEYLVILLDEESGVTVIGRADRDYVWIMARAPEIPVEEFGRFVAFVGERGYDVTKIRRVPQKWTGAGRVRGRGAAGFALPMVQRQIGEGA